MIVNGSPTVNRPELLNQSRFLNLPSIDLRRLAASGLSKRTFVEMNEITLNDVSILLSMTIDWLDTDAQLNNASAYFDLGTRFIRSEHGQVYHYVSTRNNDFSNRDQKGRIIIQPYEFQYTILTDNECTIEIG
jgi:PhoPQ-activated pathogenicity-related protein